ncbi:hypothetical protein [Mycoplasmopsis columboralis]|uniref:Uncharacterized protein n=1 Tax=Mycoplasmopsis columboralis TaxID=171282 RepID=A0A449B5S9_9BACT|nr:hypothetical protein [Mycoplasmopsis columboralis]VEU75963.1 Uncharacterised protein [Mycoplasmopsis columboralis]
MAAATIKNLWEEAKSVGSVGTTFVPLNLSQQQANSVLVNFLGKSILSNYLTQGNNLIKSDQATATFAKMQGGQFKFKGNDLGNKNADKFTVSAPLSVHWFESIVANQAITAQEAEESQTADLAKKVDFFINQFVNATERTAVNELEAKIKADGKGLQFDYTTKTPYEIRKKILETARKLSRTYDPVQGIDGIEEDQIIVLVKPEVLDAIAGESVGNYASTAIVEGAKALQKVGGFDIIAHPHMHNYDIIVTTKFLMVKADSLIKVYAGDISNNSSDKVVTVEGKTAVKVIYDNLAYGLAKTLPSSIANGTYVLKPQGAADVQHQPAPSAS